MGGGWFHRPFFLSLGIIKNKQMEAIKILAFADLNSAAVLESEGFKIEVDDAMNRVISAEVYAADVLEALGYCEKLELLQIVGNVFYNGEHFYTDDFFNKDFSDAELGLV